MSHDAKHTPLDRFVCRREGRDPEIRITAGLRFVDSYLTRCKRCGKLVTVSPTRETAA